MDTLPAPRTPPPLFWETPFPGIFSKNPTRPPPPPRNPPPTHSPLARPLCPDKRPLFWMKAPSLQINREPEVRDLADSGVPPGSPGRSLSTRCHQTERVPRICPSAATAPPKRTHHLSGTGAIPLLYPIALCFPGTVKLPSEGYRAVGGHSSKGIAASRYPLSPPQQCRCQCGQRCLRATSDPTPSWRLENARGGGVANLRALLGGEGRNPFLGGPLY